MALSHDVYIGEDADSVADATMMSPEYKGRVEESFFTGTDLNANQEYFWRVDEVAGGRGGIIIGAVWSFETGAARQYEEIYESEDAYLSGPEVESTNDGYTGTGYVDYINTSGDYAEYSIFAHYSGTHEFEFRYALASGNRPLEIRINGEVIEESLSFPSTGSWANWAYTERISGTLNAGNNVLRATIADYKGANVDHLKVIEDYPYSESDPGLQVCLQLDESSGGTAADSSGNGREGTLHGGVVWQPGDGWFGGAVRLDGSDDYIEVQGYKGVTGSNPRTVGLWVNSEGLALGDIVSWGANNTGNRWSLGFSPRGGMFGVNIGGGFIFAVESVTDGAWHHVAAVVPEAGSDLGDIRLYVDGKDETVPGAVGPQIDTAIGENLKIGTFDDGSGRFFAGSVDDFIVFDVALTDEQVSRLCRVGSESFIRQCGRVDRDPGYDLAGDINKDCKVDGLDVLLLVENWLESGASLLGDLHQDNSVNWLDVSVLGENWHEQSN
jgi:hypothetical protein